MAQQTIVAQFDIRSDAQNAMDALVAAGISRTSVSMLPGTDAAPYARSTTDNAYDRSKDEGGFWSSLSNLMLPDEDRYSYAEGMSRGAVTLSITVDDAQAARAHDILERHNAVEMDEREASWKSEGWTGYAAAATGTAGTSALAASGGSAVPVARGAGAGDEVIQVVEEQLRVGKRQVQGGKVRVRSYVVETPVQEQVTLREERINVERVAVNRPLTAADQALFQERTIEATATSEEAVVSKEARVTEELRIHKDVEQRTQTVSDTVRKTEVEVDDQRVDASRSATATPTRTPR